MNKMATMHSRIDLVSNMLTCQRCMHLFDGKEHFPKLLDCLHSICEQCVKSQLANDQSQVQCASCKVFRQVPPDGFPDNKLVLNYLQNLKDTPGVEPSIQIKCGSCFSNGAVAFCEDWAMNVCKGCIDVHNLINITRIHEVENNLNTFMNKQLALRNKCEHTSSKKKRFLTLFHSTRKSQMAACSKCSAETPKWRSASVATTHEVTTPHKGPNKLMGLLVEQCREQSCSNKALFSSLDEHIREVDVDRKDKERDIDEQCRVLVESLYEQRKAAKTEVQKSCSARKRTLQDQKRQVKIICSELEGAFGFAEQLRQFSDPKDHLDLQQQVTVRMKALIEKSTTHKDFLQQPVNDDTQEPENDSTTLSPIRGSRPTFCYAEGSAIESETKFIRSL